MKRLMLLRHAKAEPASEGDDNRGSAEVVSLDSFRKKP